MDWPFSKLHLAKLASTSNIWDHKPWKSARQRKTLEVGQLRSSTTNILINVLGTTANSRTTIARMIWRMNLSNLMRRPIKFNNWIRIRKGLKHLSVSSVLLTEIRFSEMAWAFRNLHLAKLALTKNTLDHKPWMSEWRPRTLELGQLRSSTTNILRSVLGITAS